MKGKYSYAMRQLMELKYIVFIVRCATPEALEDQTIKCQAFSAANGTTTAFSIINLFDSTEDSEGNTTRAGFILNEHIPKLVDGAVFTVAGWGNNSYGERILRILKGKELHCIGNLKDGGPLSLRYLDPQCSLTRYIRK